MLLRTLGGPVLGRTRPGAWEYLRYSLAATCSVSGSADASIAAAGSCGEVVALPAMIASATEEQAGVAEEIDKNINRINDMGQQTLVAVEQTVNDNQRLEQMSGELQQSVYRFVTS